MTNLILFVVTTLAYWVLYQIFYDSYNTVVTEPLLLGKRAFKHLGIFALLCLPFNINGNAFTVLGNVHSTGVKNAYSVFSIYQNAENTAFSLVPIFQKAGHVAGSIFGPLYQKAGDAALTGLSISLYQEAGHDAVILGGVSAYQKANKAIVGAGISAYQKANQTAALIVGISGIQIAEAKDTIVAFGISGFQKAKILAALGLGFGGYQYGSELATTTIGLTIWQTSDKDASTLVAMAINQRAGQKERTFAVWSNLKAE